jgi:hypothetical protein
VPFIVSVAPAAVAPYLLGAAGVVLLLIAIAYVMRTRLATWLAQLSSESSVVDAVARLATILACSIVVLLGSMELLASLGFMAGMGISVLDFALAVLASMVCTIFAAQAYLPVRWLASTFVVLGLLAVSFAALLLLAGWTFDASGDGNTTHQVATVALAGGWNPVRAPAVDRQRHGQWMAVQYYAKGAWIRDAVVYRLTGRLEQAKVNNLLLLLAALAAWLALLLRIAPGRPWVAVVGSIAAAFNPVSIQQSFVFLVDGQVSSLSVLFVGLAGLLFTELGQWPILIGVAAALAMLATVKFTGLVFAVVLAAGLAWAAVARRPSLRASAVLGCLASALAIAVFITGFNPYVINTVQQGSPFYPMIGPRLQEADIVSNLEPPNFVGKSNLERLALSLFSKSADFGETSQLKVPFSIARSEIRPYLGFQTPVAGFGPWFGGVLLVAALLVVLLLANRTTRSDPVVRWALFACVVIAVSALVNPEAWWARYSPQLWLVPVIVALTAIYRAPARWEQALGWAACVALVLDAAFVGSISAANVVHARLEIGAALDIAASWPHGAQLQQGVYEEDWVKFAERGIRYRLESSDATLSGGQQIPYLTAVIAPIR